MRSKRINLQLVFPALLSGLMILAAGCGSHAEVSPAKQDYILPDSLARRLHIDSVKKTVEVNAINLTGKVAYNEEHVVKVFPLISGVVQDSRVLLGDYVQKGQELAIIRSSEMAGYSTDLITAQTNLQVAKKTLDATTDMYKSGLANVRDYVSAQSGYEQAEAALIKAQRILQINGGSTNGNYVVRAPISGFIVEKFLTNNMAIRPDNSTNLFTISDLKNVWVLANVYESNIPYIHVGEDVDVTTISYPDRTFHGRVDKMMNVLDPTNKVMKVRIVLPNPGYVLKPEMFANVTIQTKTNGKLMMTVPSSAVIFDNSQNYVLVYKSNSNITIRPVMVDASSGNKTYISAGLQEGERVIASDALLIYQQLNS
jgi:cobalt-zinc-cadmium efflux system membrane fusion protein